MDIGMSKQRYLDMCKTMGDKVDYDKIPPDYEDFPHYVHIALNIFNSLPDNYSGGMSTSYVGKDLSALPVLLDLFEVSKEDNMLVFEVIQFLDSRARKQAIREAKKEAKKASSK